MRLVTLTRIRPLALMLATLAFGAAPFLTEPFRGYDPAIFPVVINRPAIQPAGFAFSIWGLIYLGLFLHAGYGLLRRSTDPVWDGIRLPLGASLLMGAGWLWLANVDPIWATVLIWAMLGTALVAAFRAHRGAEDRWLRLTPVAVYAGWLSAAASVSLGVVVAGYGWLGNTETAAAMLALVLALAVLVQMRLPRAPEYGLTVIWALIGVVAANAGDNLTVALLAAGGIVIMGLTVASLARHREA